MPVNTEIPASMFPWVYKKIVERHEVVAFDSLRELPAEASIDKQSYEAMGTQANLNIPVVVSRSDVYSLILHCGPQRAQMAGGLYSPAACPG